MTDKKILEAIELVKFYNEACHYANGQLEKVQAVKKAFKVLEKNNIKL